MSPTGTAASDTVRCLDHASMLGVWRNTDAAAGGIRRLVLTERADVPWLRVFGPGRPEPYDWGEAPVTGFGAAPNSTAAWAFTAGYDTGQRAMTLTAYLSGGLVVLNTFHAFRGAGWPVPYWTREFFYRDGSPAPPARLPRGGILAWRDRADRATASIGPWQLDPSELTGTWQNVDSAATRLAAVQIAERSGYLVIRPYGVWMPRRHDWHEAVGGVFTEDVRRGTAAAFTAVFELAVGRVEMVGFLERRLLTIQTATTFGDGSGRAPYLVQEHFYSN